MRSGRMEFETLAKILLLTAFLIIVLLMFKGCVDAYRDLGSVTMKDYMCWASNVMRANVAQVWPSTCRTQVIQKEQVDRTRFGNLMGTCWWQYGQGMWDIGGKQEFSLSGAATYISAKDIVHTCYAVIPKEDIKIDDLKIYMETHNVKGQKVSKAEETMWNYIQRISKEDNVCFDKNDKGVLRKGEVYYIKFMDDRAAIGGGKKDLLLISANKEFFEGWILRADSWYVELFKGKPCYEYGTESTAPDRSEKTIDQAIAKVNECAKIETEKECYCGDIEVIGNNVYSLYSMRIQGGSGFMVVDTLPPSAELLKPRTQPLNQGIELQAMCMPGSSIGCNTLLYDLTNSKQVEATFKESICCKIGTGRFYVTVKNEEKKGVKTKVVTVKPSLGGEIKKCGG